jgi:hypothetical protein
MQGSVRSAIIASLLFLLILTAPVSAATVTVTPDIVQKNGQITVDIKGLAEGASFSLNIDGDFVVVPGSWSSFQTNNFNMPFALNDGTISATTTGTTTTTFSVKPSWKSSAYNIVAADEDDGVKDGHVTISESYTITKGLYNFLKLGGSIRQDTTLLSTQMNLLGTKYDPAKSPDSQITFNVGGIDNGRIHLFVFVNGAQVADKIVIVGIGIPTPVPTTAIPTDTATTVVTTSVQATGTATSTTAVPTGSVTATATTGTTATETTSVLATNPTPTASATAISQKTFYSADRKVTLRTQGVEYATLLMVSETKVPDSWLMVSRAYTIAPDSLAFSPHATISFVTPASGNDYAYFVGRYVTNDWAAVSSTAGTGTIDGEVDLAGTYALMAFRPESTIQPTAAGTAQATTPTPLVTVTTKPKIASIAQAAPSSPAAAPTRTPVDVMVVAGALATGIALFARKRR